MTIPKDNIMSDTTKDAVPLKQCPMCGSEAFVTKGFCLGGQWKHGEFHRVFCGTCQLRQLFNKTEASAIAAWNRRAPAQVQAEAVQVGSISRLVAFHAEQLEANPYCYFELAYTRQTDWMAWITDRPAQGEPGTAAYAKSRKVIVRGQGATAEEACADALAALAAPSTGDQS